jgi:hypothetical protein
MSAHMMFWPFQVYSFWMNAVAMPWMQVWQATSLPPAAATLPAATVLPSAVGLDPVSAAEIGSSATDFR